ncbi:hypothetical protein SCHPADRAFT_1003151 [Schizopora paradoxa]|uniref:Uncharacterized protein n=1 Tax=Schizopora paradoxa TaxID=27342 RepID=A0A0H2QZT1_9AGAM|nr:hypothetical protein SCHPADRAFT_1003151 [Schizopora paradoxa]
MSLPQHRAYASLRKYLPKMSLRNGAGMLPDYILAAKMSSYAVFNLQKALDKARLGARGISAVLVKWM